MAAIRNILQFVDKRMTAEKPMMDARLPDGSRVHVAMPPCSRKGIVVTIRKFSRQALDMDFLVGPVQPGRFLDRPLGLVVLAVVAVYLGQREQVARRLCALSAPALDDDLQHAPSPCAAPCGGASSPI
jgi:hypothetical protein